MMKSLLRLLLILCFIVAGVYATFPMWSPGFLARQLPPGWQLEELQSGYPGLTGINIQSMRVTGEIGVAEMAITSSDSRFTYRGLRTDIGQASLDVFLHAASNQSVDTLTLDDLVLPVTNLTGKLPRLSIRQLQLAVHLENSLPAFAGISPLLFELNNIDLLPRAEQSFHLGSQLVIAQSIRPKGRLDVDVAPGLSNVAISFPSDTRQPPWLALEIVQEDLPAQTTTRIQAVLNTSLANQDWLDSLLADSTGQIFSRLEGQFELQAVFSGRGLQSIEYISVNTNKLLLVANEGTLGIEADLLASREGEKVVITLPVPAGLTYQGNAGWVDELLTSVVPGLQLAARSRARIISEIDSNSRFEFLPGEITAASYAGDVKVDLSSGGEQLSLTSDGLQLEMANIYKPESIAAEGLFRIEWNVSAPVSYTSDSLRLDAAGLSISTDLVATDGGFTSHGGGTFMQARVSPQSVYSDEIEMTWQNLDLIKRSGKLTTRTQGLSTQFNNETWEGFDFDVDYSLLNGTDINGSGIVKLTSGSEFPIKFEGNVEAPLWNVKLMPSSIPLTKLRNLLSMAHYQLPSSIKLTDGLIELQGDVVLDKEIEAKMRINGLEMGASLHKSRARESNFTLDAGYDNRMWVRGPVAIDTIELAGGIEMANVKSVLEIEGTERVALKMLSAELFDGKVESDSLKFSENRIEDTLLEFSHINLELLLNLADIDGLDGTGFLDISLPAGSDQTGIHIKNGTFTATGPGRLAYTKDGIAASNIGLQALENFEYKGLSGTLNYQSDGTYLMTVRLEGKNPDLYGGHPVIFNLTVNGSLPAFFDAMFKTGSFEEAILNEINSR